MKRTISSVMMAVSASLALIPQVQADPFDSTDLTNATLVLCANKSGTVFKTGHLPAGVGDTVSYWQNILFPTQQPDYQGVQQPVFDKQPVLVTGSYARGTNTLWIRFDGTNDFLTTFFTNAIHNANVPSRTIIVVMKMRQGPPTSPTTFHHPPAGSNIDPTMPNCIDPSISSVCEKENPPETIIGNQFTDGIFSEFGVSGQNRPWWMPWYWLIPGHPYPWKWMPSYRWEVMEPVPTPPPTKYFWATGSRIVDDNKMHVIAVTQEVAGTTPASHVRLYENGAVLWDHTWGASPHVLSMTCVGAGYSDLAALKKDKTDASIYDLAANFFRGDISAVVIYEHALNPSQISAITQAFQTNPNGLW